MYQIGTVDNTVTVFTYEKTAKMARTEIKLKEIGENTLLATYIGEAKVVECSGRDSAAEKQQLIRIGTYCERKVSLLASASVMIRSVLPPHLIAGGHINAPQLPKDRAGLQFFSPPRFCRVSELRTGDYLHLDYDYAATHDVIPHGQPISCLKSLPTVWLVGTPPASRIWQSPWWAVPSPGSIVGDRIGYWLPITEVRLLAAKGRPVACTVDRLGLAIVSGIATQVRCGKLEAVDGKGA